MFPETGFKDVNKIFLYFVDHFVAKVVLKTFSVKIICGYLLRIHT